MNPNLNRPKLATSETWVRAVQIWVGLEVEFETRMEFGLGLKVGLQVPKYYLGS